MIKKNLLVTLGLSVNLKNRNKNKIVFYNHYTYLFYLNISHEIDVIYSEYVFSYYRHQLWKN